MDGNVHRLLFDKKHSKKCKKLSGADVLVQLGIGLCVGASGYFLHVDNSAYAGHLAIDRLLDSPYVDFLAAPKSYYRNKAGE